MDIELEETFDVKFTTRTSAGVPITFSGSPAIDVYEDNSTTQITGADTLTVDFDSITGLNNLRIAATTANGFESGKSYSAVVSAGTVDGNSVVGEVILNFTIERSAALKPTTRGRTLDVTANGTAGINWGNLENGLTSVALSNTVIAGVTVSSMGSNVLTAAALATDAVQEIRDAITGGAYALDTDANGRIRIVDGTGAGELDTNGGLIAGIAGTLNTFDALDTAQDTQHALTQGLIKYLGYHGPGVFYDAAAGNTNTTVGTDGTWDNPVSTLAAATTLAVSLGSRRIYVINGSTLTLTGQTLSDYQFIGIGDRTSNIVNLGTAASQSVLTNCDFIHLYVYGQHDFSDRIELHGCAIDDAPAAEVTKLRCWATDSVLVGDFQLDTSDDNLFDGCASGVPGNGYPVVTCTGAAGSFMFRHYSGGLGVQNLSASHTFSVETDGQVVFESGCNVNATGALRGMLTIVDNTAGMNNLTIAATAQSLSDKIDVADSVADAIKAKTDNLTFTIAGNVDSNPQSWDDTLLSISSPFDTVATAIALQTVDDNVDSLVTSVAALPSQSDITGGAYALDTDANGRIRIVDGTGAGELDTASGLIAGIAGTKNTLDDLNDITVSSLLTTQMTESYAANGVAPTVAQALFAIHQKLMQMAYSGTSSNTYQLDNSTLAFVGTMDDATNPTEDRRV